MIDHRPDPAWPDPVADPLGHTLAVFHDSPDDDLVVMATGNVYGNGVRTGLTWRDLRRTHAELLRLRAQVAAVAVLCGTVEDALLDRRPRDKHGPVGPRPEASVRVSRVRAALRTTS